jgi:hypothetical protein
MPLTPFQGLPFSGPSNIAILTQYPLKIQAFWRGNFKKRP